MISYFTGKQIIFTPDNRKTWVYPMQKNVNVEEVSADKPLRVLLAEDDSDDCELFEDALHETGINAELTIVNDGRELVETLKDKDTPNPDIVFVDINMPFKDGQQAVAEIKADPELAAIPTVVLSTSDNPQGIQKSFNAGADFYIQKPSSFRNFVKLLQNVFSFHWAGRLFRTTWEKFFLSEKHLPNKDV